MSFSATICALAVLFAPMVLGDDHDHDYYVDEENIFEVSLGVNCDAVAYDSENGWWLLADVSNDVVRAWAPNGGSDPTGGVFGPIYAGMGNYTWQYPTGMWRDNDNDILYLVSKDTGYILGINTTNNQTVYSLDSGNVPNDICYNSENNMLYVTASGLESGSSQQIWELEMDLTPSRTFLTSSDDIFPNGCIVNDDTLYIVQIYGGDDQDIIDALSVIYWTDISSSSPTQMQAGAALGLQYIDGIAMDPDGNLWIGSWGSAATSTNTDGSIYVLVAEHIDDTDYEWDQVTDPDDVTIQSPGTMAIDTVNGWLLVPSVYGQKLYVINPVLEEEDSAAQLSIITVVVIAVLSVLFS